MFKVTARPEFKHTVNVVVPIDGGHENQTLQATFRVLASDKDEDGFDLNTTGGSTAFLKEAVVRLDDLVGSDDKPLHYSDGLRDQLLKLPYVRVALARGYFEAITKAALGN